MYLSFSSSPQPASGHGEGKQLRAEWRVSRRMGRETLSDGPELFRRMASGLIGGAVTHPRSLSDSQLVALCREGDAEAWNEVVERFSRYVYAITQRGFGLRAPTPRTSSRRSSPGCTNASATCATTRRPATVAGPDHPEAVHRRVAQELVGNRSTESLPEPVDDEWIARLDESLSVHQAMDELPDNCQEVLDRFFCRDESYRVIGDTLDIPAGTIASRISRCLAQMRESLGKETGEEARQVSEMYDEDASRARSRSAAPPKAWIRAAQQLPSARAALDGLVERALADA